MSGGGVVAAFGMAEDRNKSHRRKMEDAQSQQLLDAPRSALFALFDGHSGRDAALFCATHVAAHVAAAFADVDAAAEDDVAMATRMTRAFDALNAALAAQPTDAIPPHQGCTAVIALVLRVSDSLAKLVVGNAGDARALLIHSDNSTPPRRLTVDHVASDPAEVARVLAAGGFVSNDRVNGQLEVTRSLGDQLMKAYVVATPHTSVTLLDADAHFKYLVLGCDGIWDVLDDQFVADTLRDPQHADLDCAALSKVLVAWALQKGSTDNLSAQVIALH
jgi:protein phosphatase PTC1